MGLQRRARAVLPFWHLVDYGTHRASCLVVRAARENRGTRSAKGVAPVFEPPQSRERNTTTDANNTGSKIGDGAPKNNGLAAN
jgi:hypothetical protein